jgi:hypothetical protein
MATFTPNLLILYYRWNAPGVRREHINRDCPARQLHAASTEIDSSFT